MRILFPEHVWTFFKDTLLAMKKFIRSNCLDMMDLAFVVLAQDFIVSMRKRDSCHWSLILQKGSLANISCVGRDPSLLLLRFFFFFYFGRLKFQKILDFLCGRSYIVGLILWTASWGTIIFWVSLGVVFFVGEHPKISITSFRLASASLV